MKLPSSKPPTPIPLFQMSKRRMEHYLVSCGRRKRLTIPIMFLAALIFGMMHGSAFAASVPATIEPAASFFDQGNSLIKAGQPGQAILAYERAKQLAPRDPAIAQNLSLARDQTGAVKTPMAWWQQVAGLFTLNEWAWSGSIALALICLAVVVERRLPPWSQLPLKALTLACFLTLLGSATALWLRWPDLNRGIVVSPHALTLIAPAQSAAPAFPLVEGETVSIKKQFRDFVFVSSPGGRSGWLQNDQIGRIIPGT